MTNIHGNLTDAKLDGKTLKGIIGSVLKGERKKGMGDLSLILVDNVEIQRLNKLFLNKDRPTDVIAFPLEDDMDGIWGEIYISLDQVRCQAEEYHVDESEELARLVIHGVLHLCGYDDSTEETRNRMSTKEDEYLVKLSASG